MANPATTAEIVLATKRTGEQAFKSLEADLGKLGQRAALIGTAAAAALTLITKRSFENIDALAKASDALAVHTEQLAGLRHGADLAGVGSDELDAALQRQRKTLYDATLGVSGATEALELLGLESQELMRLNTYEQFLRIADSLSEVENATERAALAQKVFGRGVSLEFIAMMSEGSDAMAGFAEEADRLGLAVSRLDAAKVEAANDAMSRVRSRIAGLGNVIAVELAPIIEGMAGKFLEASGDAEEMGATARRAIDGIATGAGVVGDAFHGWRMIFQLTEIAILKMSEVAVQSFAAITAGASNVYELMSKINPLMTLPAVGLDVASSNLASIAESLHLSGEDAATLLAELAAAEKPSEKIAAAMERWRAASEASAQGVAARAAEVVATGGAPVIGDDGSSEAATQAAAEADERMRVQLETQLEQVRQHTLTREQIEIEAMNRRQQIIHDAHEQGLIDQMRAQELSAEVSRLGQEELTRIAEEGWTERQKFAAMSTKMQAATILGMLEAQTAGVAQHSRSMFNVNKIAAIGTATLNMHRGISEALALGPIIGPAMAAAAAAAGAAQIAAIKSTSFGGGGGGTTPSLAGSTPTLAGQPVSQVSTIGQPSDRRGEIRVEVHGNNFYGPGGAEDFAELITDVVSSAANDRDVVIISHESRQAAVIRGG
jgi:hypothetical protein